MLPQRTPLSSIDGNRRGRGLELTPYKRGRIEGARIAGMSPREIEVLFRHSCRAVRSTLAVEKSRSNRVSLPRPSQPLVYDERDRRSMLRSLQSYPKLTYQQRCDNTSLKMSNTYIKNLAQEHGIHHWRAKKRLELTPKTAAERLLWCKVRRH
jgi:hypothetical protein